MSVTADPDLRDVFKMLYGEDDEADWAMSDDEETTPNAVSTAPGRDVEAGEEDITTLHTARYTRKRFQSELESLFTRSPAKKARIFPKPASAIKSPEVYTSLIPLPPLPPIDVYAPYSPLPLLTRLRTFAQNGFTDLDSPLDAISLARQGWTATGLDDVQCGRCGARFSLRGIGEIVDVGVRREVVKRLGGGMRERHEGDCAWRVRDSPDGLVDRLRQMLHPIVSVSLAPLAQRLEEETGGHEIRWTSPLTDEQQTTLQKSLSRHLGSAPTLIAANMAWFAWYPYHPNALSTAIDPTTPAEPTEILHCRICQRRVGLWTFKITEKKGDDEAWEETFDLVKEHLGWCPIRQGSWWVAHPFLAPASGLSEGVGAGAQPGTGSHKGWVKVSDRMERKPWRRG